MGDIILIDHITYQILKVGPNKGWINNTRISDHQSNEDEDDMTFLECPPDVAA